MDHYGENFIDPDLVVLEVKVTHSVPLWLTRILQDLNCEQNKCLEILHKLGIIKRRHCTC